MTGIIETERLFLRPWRESDAGALYKYASDPRVSEMAHWPCHTSEEMSRRVIMDFFIPNPLNFAITLKDTGEPIGCIGLVPPGEENFTPEGNEREVGYWLGYPYWGRGITAEALLGLIDRLCGSLHLDSLLITTDAANAASRRVAGKCGFVHIADIDNDGIPTKVFRRSLVASRLKIMLVREEKMEYMDLLLIGDESVEMIMKYLDRGNLYAGSVDGKVVAVIVSTEEPDGTVEIKNLAVAPDFRRKSIGRMMLRHIEEICPGRKIIVGTGETPSTLRFYESCGYRRSYVVPDFFTDNYPYPITEEGVVLGDMIYLSKNQAVD